MLPIIHSNTAPIERDPGDNKPFGLRKRHTLLQPYQSAPKKALGIKDKEYCSLIIPPQQSGGSVAEEREKSKQAGIVGSLLV